MDRKFLVIIIAGLFILIQFTISLANITEAVELHRTSHEYQSTEIFTTLSSTETSHLILNTNEANESSVVSTESSKRKKTRLLQERPRRQGYGYGYFPAKYGINTLFDMCPPLATTCPICTNDGVQVPPGFCNSVVLKVLAISSSQIDANGRVCGKFGMLKFYGDFNEKEFRRLLRFSVSETCGCVVKASAIYFLISPLSTFLKDGLLFNQIVLTEQAVLISADRYIENEILEVLNNCPVAGYDPEIALPYDPPPAPDPYLVIEPPSVSHVPPPTPYVAPATNPHAPYVPPIAPVVPPVTNPPTPYVPPPAPHVSPPAKPPAPYVPPPTKPPPPYVPPPTKPPPPYVPALTEPPAVYPLPPAPPTPYNPPPVVPTAPYNPTPVQQPVSTSYQVRPVPAQLPLKQLQPSHFRGKIPFLYPSLTQCLIPDSCPVCARLDKAGDITGQYCFAGFAYLAVIRVPDASLLKGAESSYSGPTCMNLRTNIVYDITRTRDPKIVVSALTALLPTKCVTCFEGLSGPVIVLIMGQVPPVPPVVQIDASFQVYILPVPATIVLPSCETYSMYGTLAVPYSLLPIAPQPYVVNDCPEAGDQTCPLCQNYPDTSFAAACAAGFAIVTELNLAGPYFTSQRLPVISVKTTTTYYSKSIEVVISDPPPIECIKGFFKIIQNLGLVALKFPGEIIPFVSLPNCECLSQGFKRLLIFSSKPLTISQEGILYLSEDINIAFLQPEAALPTCGPPPPPTYVPPPSFYIPPHQVPPSSYGRPARVPLTYIPPPPPPPAYIPPTDPPPVYILPPDYIPPPVKESSPLPSHWYIPPHLTTLDPSLPETQSPPYTTELPFEETPPLIIGCTEYINGSCVVEDTNQDKETDFFINVDKNMPYLPQFEALNSIIYEDASVWSPSFEECLCSKDPSCPHSLEDSPEKFEEFFCKTKTALIVAVGIDYSIVGNETTATKMLTFIQPELPYIGINFEDPNNPVSLKITVTQNKTMDRRIQLQNNADYCYKEKVLVLYDISNPLKPQEVVGTLDIYIPGFCDSEIFDKIPSYGILLSLQQPSDVKNPLQLTEDFAFIPLPEGRLDLPDCGKSPEEKPSAFESSNTKFWVPKSPLESVVCELSEEDGCGIWTTVQDESFILPCNVKSAALVQIQNTSAGNSVGPNLEILETSYGSGEKVVTLSVESNIDAEDTYSSVQNHYSEDPNHCKYATVRVLKDFSRRPTIGEDDVFTIIANTACDNPIFKQTNEIVLLMSNELLFPNTVIPLDHAEVIGIPAGTTTISFCNANPLGYVDNETPLEEDTSLNDKSIPSADQDPSPDELFIDTSNVHEEASDTYETPSNAEYNERLETSCIGHKDNTCPVCEDIGSISSDVYCNSGLSLFAEVIGQEIKKGNCTNGVIASLFDITVRNGVPKSKVLKISYTIPSHCPCSVLKEGEHLVLLLGETSLITNEISISLSQGKYLYSTPLKTPLPSCYVEDSVQARSKNDNVIVLDSPYKEIYKMIPELSRNICPTIDHTCPICRVVDDKELENLYCSSEEVLLVSGSKTQKENPRKFSRIGKATFTKQKIASNYTLEMRIDEYESPCTLPLAEGNCSQSLDRFYFDAEVEMCLDFTYTGCGGNSNNFVSEMQCEKRCLVEDFCEEGILDIKKIVKSSDNANYLDNKFHYALPEHCNCLQMLKGNTEGYLLSTNVDLTISHIQLSRNNYFVPLSKKQRKKQFSCRTDGNTADSSESNTRGSETTNNTDSQTNDSEKSKKSGFRFFG
ncbi:unnamed protein product [Larinioides sclopetarius]|uniref:BPTI/Kunitz inhibitor domain-containing protein n=1 Tax=Larinioides sclopetarius TaxID=280406 RepID=A0AAV1ZYS9_9ARAC